VLVSFYPPKADTVRYHDGHSLSREYKRTLKSQESGDFTPGATPVPIPNTAVRSREADDSATYVVRK
jgi:hypothetical protein